MSDRLGIWSASLSAIRSRPVSGSGPGTDAAIAPYLPGTSEIYRGLGSHNTWLRTAVELGLPGLVAFGLFVTALVRELARARRTFHSETWPPVTAVFVALLVSEAFDIQLLGWVGRKSLAWPF